MYHNELALHTLTVSLFAASEYLVFLFFIVVEVEVSTEQVACISYLHIIMYTKW